MEPCPQSSESRQRILLLDPDADRPFDRAKARITIAEENGSTTFNITVSKIDSVIIGKPLDLALTSIRVLVLTDSGGSAAHYNHDVVTGAVVPARINRETEVWFDLVPDAEGVAHAETTVPFVPDDSFPDRPDLGSRRHVVVIHDGPTNPTTGTAGNLRQACFPLSVPQWASDGLP